MSKTEFENFWAWQMEAMQKKENLEFGPLDYLLEIFEDAPFFLFRDYYLFVCYFSWTLLCVCKQQTGDVVVRAVHSRMRLGNYGNKAEYLRDCVNPFGTLLKFLMFLSYFLSNKESKKILCKTLSEVILRFSDRHFYRKLRALF